MNAEKRARRQSFRVIFSEIVMFIAVVATVAVLALVVSGYWLNSDFKVERQGMLQVYSAPTGASVAVDGDSPWFQRTNTSKVLSSGEHDVNLTKDGYDSWSKTVVISEGLLYRLNYPRLFLNERVKETISDAKTTTFATVSPNRKTMLLANNTTKWSLVNLDADKPEFTDIDVSEIFSSVSRADDAASGLFTGEILSAEWDGANEHILFKYSTENGTEWLLFNVKQPASSLNITTTFAAYFDDARILDNSADRILVIHNGSLHKINLSSRQISAAIARNVTDYDFYESETVFVSEDHVSLIKDEQAPVTIQMTGEAKVRIGKFYDEKYIFVIDGTALSIYQEDTLEEIYEGELGFTPESIKVGPDSEFIAMNSGSSFATFDMESMKLVTWNSSSSHHGWLDGYMLYAVNEGELSVYDFDGLNARKLATNVSNHFPVTITADKWLYYFSDDNLVREWLITK